MKLIILLLFSFNVYLVYAVWREIQIKDEMISDFNCLQNMYKTI